MAKTAPIVLTSFNADESLDPQPPIEWIVEGLFSAGSVSLLVGVGGSKKTWSMLDCAVCVSKGYAWLDFISKPVPVVIIDEESGTRRLKRRLSSVMRAHAIGKQEVQIECVSLAGLNLLDPSAQAALLALVIKHKAQFVVIDALIDVLIGGDENNAADVQAVFRGLRQIAEATQAAIVVIHHMGKNGGHYRGSSAMQGAIDLLLNVESEPTSPNIDFSSEKTRDVQAFNFAAVIHFDEFNDTVMLTSSLSRPKAEYYSKAEDFVLRFLSAKGEAYLSDIMNNADTCSAEAARRAVYNLAKRSKIRRKNAGQRGAEALYELHNP